MGRASGFTKKRLRHSLKLKTDPVTEFATVSVITIHGKDLKIY